MDNQNTWEAESGRQAQVQYSNGYRSVGGGGHWFTERGGSETGADSKHRLLQLRNLLRLPAVLCMPECCSQTCGSQATPQASRPLVSNSEGGRLALWTPINPQNIWSFLNVTRVGLKPRAQVMCLYSGASRTSESPWGYFRSLGKTTRKRTNVFCRL